MDRRRRETIFLKGGRGGNVLNCSTTLNKKKQSEYKDYKMFIRLLLNSVIGVK